jgi:hypothetical protein
MMAWLPYCRLPQYIPFVYLTKESYRPKPEWIIFYPLTCGNVWNFMSHFSSLISGFRRDVDVIYGLLGYYTASCGNYLPTLLYSRHISPIILTLPPGRTRPYCDLVSTPLSSYWLSSHHTFPYPAVLSRFFVTGFLSYSESWPVRMGPIRCSETSVNNYHTTPCNNPEDHIFHFSSSSFPSPAQFPFHGRLALPKNENY